MAVSTRPVVENVSALMTELEQALKDIDVKREARIKASKEAVDAESEYQAAVTKAKDLHQKYLTHVSTTLSGLETVAFTQLHK